MDFITPIMSGLISSAFDVGSQAVSNRLISQPNSALAYEQQMSAMGQQDRFNQRAATKAYRRSTEAAGIAYQRAAMEAEKAWNREKTLYGERYQTTMDDMRKAGLNPILAASSGFNVGTGASSHAPSISMAQAPMSSVGSGSGYTPDYPQAGSSALKFAQAKTEGERQINLSSGTNKNLADAVRSLEEISLVRARVGHTTAQEQEALKRIKKIEVEIPQIVRRTEEINEHIDLLNSQKHLTEKQSEVQDTLRKKYAIEEEKTKQMVKEIMYSLEQLENIANVYKGPGGQILTYVKEITKSLGFAIPAAGYALGKGVGAFKKFGGK